jgi:hypothetical protein
MAKKQARQRASQARAFKRVAGYIRVSSEEQTEN